MLISDTRSFMLAFILPAAEMDSGNVKAVGTDSLGIRDKISFLPVCKYLISTSATNFLGSGTPFKVPETNIVVLLNPLNLRSLKYMSFKCPNTLPFTSHTWFGFAKAGNVRSIGANVRISFTCTLLLSILRSSIRAEEGLATNLSSDG